MKKILLSILVLGYINASAQISGNQMYNDNNNNNYFGGGGQNHAPQNSISASGDQFTISTRVLMNVRPDVLVVTLGVNQEAKTVKGCNDGIKKRIDGFLKAIKTLGVKEADVYTDFISQTKIYDYEVGETRAVQKETGFEVKKNIIIRLTNVKAFNELTDVASEFAIYDIVKAEYINENVDVLYAKLFDEAVKSIDYKKQKYVKAFKATLSDDFNIIQDSYYSVQPRTQYQKYSAFESSDLTYVSNDQQYVRKEARKAKTFYYQGIDTSSFDKVINPSDPEVCLQYVVEMKIVYHIKR
ncbi:SIMPL domain-containing protein [Flavobacterium sp. DGU11]|uniref:SIMPL domain-containing protein n=1 Tax=Flavobacterium arundinis TaxID=3139143 RepID=A0ABU9HZV5_9FLAO